jgi:hypothetical protein
LPSPKLGRRALIRFGPPSPKTGRRGWEIRARGLCDLLGPLGVLAKSPKALKLNGEGGIRTPVGFDPKTDFESGVSGCESLVRQEILNVNYFGRFASIILAGFCHQPRLVV